MPQSTTSSPLSFISVPFIRYREGGGPPSASTLASICKLMLVWCVLGLLLLQTTLNFGGFDFGTIYCVTRGLGGSAEIG